MVYVWGVSGWCMCGGWVGGMCVGGGCYVCRGGGGGMCVCVCVCVV